MFIEIIKQLSLFIFEMHHFYKEKEDRIILSNIFQELLFVCVYKGN